MQFKAKAPGSLMLLGEYAVLQGGYALVCAVDKSISVTLTPRSDDKILIHSSLHGNYETDLAHLEIVKPFQFVLAAIKQQKPKMRTGCELNISTEFSDQVGFGSSAAVTVATLATLLTWLKIRVSSLDLIRLGRRIVREVQGVGSGADVAASVSGGMVAYRAEPFSLEKYSQTYPISAWYAGFKMKTPEVLQLVSKQFSAHPELFRSIQKSIGQCAIDGLKALRSGDFQTLGKIMNIQQSMMQALGVSTPFLEELVEGLRESQEILGAKISGSGLGDCVVGLGSNAYLKEHLLKAGASQIPVEMTREGVSCEKI